jgi:enoyl-CoA hydratase/carnithine racemase
MAEASRAIVTEITDCIAILRFNRAAERNPLSVATLRELRVALSALIKDEDLNTIIFTGTDDVFAAGADIRELAQLDPGSCGFKVGSVCSSRRATRHHHRLGWNSKTSAHHRQSEGTGVFYDDPQIFQQ